MNSRILIGVCSLVVAFGVWQILTSGFVSGAGTVKPGGFRVMNVETGYRYTIDIDENFPGWPLECKDTGKKTCYSAELCPNPACRTAGERTWVVLNSSKGKAGDTLCPQCGQKVTMLNMGAEDLEPETQPADKSKPKKRGRRSRRSRSGG